MITAENQREPGVLWRVGPALPAPEFDELRRRMILDHCKWDPQVGDVSTLAPFPIFLSQQTWDELCQSARVLSAELLAAETELLARPDLLGQLGMPGPIKRLLSRREAPPTPAALRLMRFDFHYTTDGWRISEVNNDVPGGFSESTSFAELFRSHFPGTRLCGNPADAWARAIREHVRDGIVALFAAPGFMEDQQVVSFLARQLGHSGIRTRTVTPKQLSWNNSRLEIAGLPESIDCAVRFLQAEWLAKIGCDWRKFFLGGETSLVNPGISVLGESKRFPLLWDALSTPVPTWRALLPETRDPRAVPWQDSEEWVLKTAYCNNGDSVSVPGAMPKPARRKLWWDVKCFPGSWAAQRRFHPLWFDTPLGLAHLCIGVYTIDGEPVGAYGRLTSKPIVDYAAVDVPILISSTNDQT